MESQRLIDGFRRFDFEGDCLAGQGLREDLDASRQTEIAHHGGYGDLDLACQQRWRVTGQR